jgi:Peptidase family M28
MADDTLVAGLRTTIEQLAPIERLPCSNGERDAAQIIAARLNALGCAAVVEEEAAFGSYAWPVGAMAGLSALVGVVAARRRLWGLVGGAVAAAGIADEISLGRQTVRRTLSPRRTTSNVVAEAGDPDADRTLVLMAHHDAAPTGAIFDQTLERRLADRFPQVVERMSENPPLWWPVVGGPVMVAAGSAIGSNRLRRAGVVVSLLTTAALADVGSRRAVPGANDNLSAVAVLLALAPMLADLKGLRVILFSAGAEEALQEGARGFAKRHFPALPKESTWFLNLDTVGSGNLVLLDAEGPLRMEPYDVAFGDLIAECAASAGVSVTRGLRSRNSTDGVVPNRHGYRSASLVSIDDQKLLPHYHLPSDTPDHVDYASVADTVRLAEAVARALAV